MNYPQTVEELIHWDVFQERDSFGTYYVITGFEGTGGCFWCGKKLEGRRRYCGHRSGHWTLYAKHFSWNYARSWCLERYNYACANCGYHQIVPHGDHPSWYTKSLEVHHIIPIEGADRGHSPYNVPWNLICLCHGCHLEIHNLMRELTKPIIKDLFELAKEKGQLVFDIS